MTVETPKPGMQLRVIHIPELRLTHGANAFREGAAMRAKSLNNFAAMPFVTAQLYDRSAGQRLWTITRCTVTTLEPVNQDVFEAELVEQ